MSGQQMFQIISAGKTLRAKPPAEVLQQISSAFSIDTQQARKLFLKGWVIKDQLSPGQVVQYRTQLQQIGLKIEVHPAGKFDNRAILARLQFAQKRKANSAKAASGNGAAAQGTVTKEASLRAEPQRNNSAASEPKVAPKSRQAPASQPSATIDAPAQSVPEPPKNTGRESAHRAQLEALFSKSAKTTFAGPAQRLALIPAMLRASLVPLVFLGLLCLCAYQVGAILWGIPAAALAGTFSAMTLVSAIAKLLLIALVGVLLIRPFFLRVTANTDAQSGESGLRLRKQEAPGLFLLLDVLQEKSGLGIAGKIQGPKNLSAASASVGTMVEVAPGADVQVQRAPGGGLKLTLGLGAVASVNGGDLLALTARALAYHQGRWVGLARGLSLTSAQRLQGMQEALENRETLAGGTAILQPLYRLLGVCGLALLPVVERLQALHRGSSSALARKLEVMADTAAAQVIGSDAFAAFAERWNQLVHADLVCGEINREAQLMGRRLANIPLAVRWMYSNLDDATRSTIELAMAESTDYWSLVEPAGHERIAAIEELTIEPLLQRVDFSVQKLFVDFEDLSTRVSRLGIEESCRAVENRLLLTASKETEETQKVLSEYFNRAIPRDFLPLNLPKNVELQELDLQATIDWLRTRLVDLQDLEQKLGQLQLRGARIQLGAALVRANVRIDSRSFDLSGSTPAAADESRRDNRIRVQECQQQRQQLHAMFFQRIQCTIAGMDSADSTTAESAVAQLQAFEAMREPLRVLEQYGDLMGELIERLPTSEIPANVVQKYPQLVSQQISQLHQLASQQSGLLSEPLMEKLAACAQSDRVGAIAANKKPAEWVSSLQAVELRCKHASAVVYEGYQAVLASLLSLCLAEEGRRKVKPLRLAGVL